MKLFTACVVAVLLWAGADALAQGKGKGKDEPTQVKEDAAKTNKPQQESKAIEEAGKDAAKGNKGARDMTSSGPKQGGPQGKKLEKPADVAEKGKGKGGQQQLQAMQTQLRHEQAKQMERQARLARIRELAVQKGDTATVARVDKLMQKQQEVYNRKLQQLQGQKRATQPPTEVGKETVTPPVAPANPPAAPETSKPAETPSGSAAGSSAGQSPQPGTGESQGAPK